jgi:hypothetical protein
MATKDELAESRGNLEAAIKDQGYIKGQVPKGAFVRVDARDTYTVASSVVVPTRITGDLHQGTTPHFHYPSSKRREVFHKADDVFHLLDQPTQESGSAVTPAE